jgi:hypothetical protein
VSSMMASFQCFEVRLRHQSSLSHPMASSSADVRELRGSTGEDNG